MAKDIKKKNEYILAKYTHGSEDSTDNDVVYLVDELPSFQECKEFCNEGGKEENRNIISINTDDGIVTKVFKGTVDEVNNAILATYSLHKQNYPLLIKKPLIRDIPLKCIRATRIIISHLSHSQYRELIKKLLTTEENDWENRILRMAEIKLNQIDFSTLNKKMSSADIMKVIAFQIGQVYGLLEGKELYTKKDIAETYPSLKPFLYRQEDANKNHLDGFYILFLYHLRKFITEINVNYNIKKEIKC